MNSMLPTQQITPTRLFDTTVFIDHLRGQNKAATELILQAISGEYPAAFSILTDVELWYGVRTGKDDKTYRLLLGRLRRLPLTIPLARRAGVIRRECNNLGTVDAIIAATAEYHSLPIYTRNTKDFERVTTIRVVGYK